MRDRCTEDELRRRVLGDFSYHSDRVLRSHEGLPFVDSRGGTNDRDKQPPETTTSVDSK